jgi:hypothetical protein
MSDRLVPDGVGSPNPIAALGLDKVIDLTRVNVEIKFTLDTVDVVLFLTTGGIGYLAKQWYNHHSTLFAR